jgi:FMN reductase
MALARPLFLAFPRSFTMPSILAVSGSPSSTSRTVAAIDHALAWLEAQGHTTIHVAVADLPPADLLSGTRTSPAVREAIAAVAYADGVIVATPIYKASYTGLLKSYLDLLPENALAGKVVLPVATGGTVGHLLAIDYALRPVLTALGADHVVPGRFLLDADILRGEAGEVSLSPEAELRLTDTLRRFSDALEPASLAFAHGVPAAVGR